MTNYPTAKKIEGPYRVEPDIVGWVLRASKLPVMSQHYDSHQDACHAAAVLNARWQESKEKERAERAEWEKTASPEQIEHRRLYEEGVR